MKKINQVILLVAMFLTSAGCTLDGCFRKEGGTREKTNYFEGVSVVEVHGTFNIELVQDTAFFIEAIAPELALEDIEYVFSDTTLGIYNYNNCFWRRDIDKPDLRIHIDDIDELNVFEASNFYSTDSISDEFKFTVRTNISEADLVFNAPSVYFYINKHSGGSYVFRGKTGAAFFMNFNTGLFDMQDLECKKARVHNYSVIDMKVNVVDHLWVEIYNSGNILYKGSPNIIIDTLTSSGRPLPF